jgi:hypothetical protein
MSEPAALKAFFLFSIGRSTLCRLGHARHAEKMLETAKVSQAVGCRIHTTVQVIGQPYSHTSIGDVMVRGRFLRESTAPPRTG